MFDDIQIDSLSLYLEDNTRRIYVTSESNEDRKKLTAVRRELDELGILENYEYNGRTKENAAYAVIEVKRTDLSTTANIIDSAFDGKSNLSVHGYL